MARAFCSNPRMPDTFEIKCKCGKVHRISKEYAGKNIRCRRCSRITRVPFLNGTTTPDRRSWKERLPWLPWKRREKLHRRIVYASPGMIKEIWIYGMEPDDPARMRRLVIVMLAALVALSICIATYSGERRTRNLRAVDSSAGGKVPEGPLGGTSRAGHVVVTRYGSGRKRSLFEQPASFWTGAAAAAIFLFCLIRYLMILNARRKVYFKESKVKSPKSQVE